MLAIQDRDGNNAVLREYTWGLNLGGGIGGLLNLKQDDADYAYLYDGKGNVEAVLDSAQNVVAAYQYDPFGNILAATGALEQPFQFSTKRYDAATGLVYYGRRFYSPFMDRWTTRDPLGEKGGLNLYAFVDNNPVNWIDPWGLFRSNDWLRALVPGQTYFDYAMTAFENGRYFEGAVGITNMLSEQVLFVMLLGQSSIVQQGIAYGIEAGGFGAGIAEAAQLGPKVVNTKLGHAADRAVERAGFTDVRTAAQALRDFGDKIRQFGIPSNAIQDAAGHWIIPGFGKGGAVVYRVNASGKLVLQTVHIWKQP